MTKYKGRFPLSKGALAWNADQLSSGSRDRMILQRDIRTPPLQSERRLQGHRQEVCGLKWSTDHQLLASGGNDNKVQLIYLLIPSLSLFILSYSLIKFWFVMSSPQLLVWNHSSLSPVQTYMDHLAAVKAIAWSPHQHGLLASGGGTADRCIRFWNTLTSQPLQCMDTGSQVCNLAWSKHANELVSDSRYTLDTFVVQQIRWILMQLIILSFLFAPNSYEFVKIFNIDISLFTYTAEYIFYISRYQGIFLLTH